MAGFNFPSTPTVGQHFAQYVWDGEKWTWTAVAGTSPPPDDGVMDFSMDGNPLVVLLEDF